MLNWAQQFNIFCFLDNQHYGLPPQHYECLLAVGATDSIEGDWQQFQHIDAFISSTDWVFGHLSYELLHPLYHIHTLKKDSTGFPPFFFFKPEAVLYIKEAVLYIEAPNGQAVYDAMTAWAFEKGTVTDVNIQQQLSKEAYLQRVRQLQQHILRGDCYEINFCTAFYAEQALLSPFHVFQNLMQLSPNPFAAFYKLNDKYLICASPERFVIKEGPKLLVQPVKGTAKRSPDAAEDLLLKNGLQSSAKEQAENVMIVDLMRNDLSKVCMPGSVKVDELFGVYSFPQVHQLVSTISGTVAASVPFSQIIKALFPMGSMTGAPKQRVLELIETYEPGARGIFSGSVGYIAPGGNFDFNVVIRSIMYNKASCYLSYQVGSGITFYSDAENEWEECLLKASAINKVLTA